MRTGWVISHAKNVGIITSGPQTTMKMRKRMTTVQTRTPVEADRILLMILMRRKTKKSRDHILIRKSINGMYRRRHVEKSA